MYFKGKDHTFVIYDGKVVAAGALFTKYRNAFLPTVVAPAIHLAAAPIPLHQPAAKVDRPCAVIEGGKAFPLLNAEVDGDGIKLLTAT